MRAARGNADERVIHLHGAAGDDFRFFHHADTEAGQVVVLIRVQAWHFSRLTADERAARLPATLADAFDHTCRDGIVQTTAGVIVEEEKRLGALHNDVVHAHRHQVDADGVVDAGVDGELELGADAIGAGYQHRFLVFSGRVFRTARQIRPALRAHPDGGCFRRSV